MEQPNDQSASSTFPLLKLPSELRNKIYKCALISSFTLRRVEKTKPDRAGRMVVTKEQDSSRRTIHRNEVRLHDWSALALLFTCRSIYNEALTILYSYNKLHFPALSKGLMLNKRQQTSFSLLQHVSFDYSYTPSAAWDEYRSNVYWTGDVAQHIDKTISVSIKHITKACPAFKTLTLHVLSFPAFVHLIALAAHNECATTVALSKLTLARLTIVGIPVNISYMAHGVLRPRENDEGQAIALNHSEYAFLASIAPWNRWHEGATAKTEASELQFWPGLKVSHGFIARDESASRHEMFPLYEYRNERQRHFMEPMRAQAWHLRPAPELTAAYIRTFIPASGLTMDEVHVHFSGMMNSNEEPRLRQLVMENTRYDQKTEILFPR